MLRRYYGKIGRLPLDQFVGHDGELVIDDETGKVYVMDGVTPGGKELTGATPQYGVSPPSFPTPGTLWYDPVSGRTFIYYQDQWVDASPNSTYSLPIASEEVLGGIKVGNNLFIDEEGFLSAEDGNYTLPVASDSVLGGIKVGNGLTITDGVLNATATSLGNLTVEDQTIIPADPTANVVIQGNLVAANVDAFSFHAAYGALNGAGYRFLNPLSGDDNTGFVHRSLINTLEIEHSGNLAVQIYSNGNVSFANTVTFNSNVFAGNVDGYSFHSKEGIGSGGGFRFLTALGGDDLSGMFHTSLTNELILDHQGKIGFRLNSDGEVSLVRGFKFNNSNVFILPQNGDIHYANGASALGSGGASYILPVADANTLGGIKLGEGFTTDVDDKVTTNKLYSTNLTQPTQHYRLELDTNGVVHLPDQSIINGATLKSVAGNYAGITAGPVGKDEDSWVWVDADGAWVATKYNTDQKVWQFNNDGNVILPEFGTINYSNGMSILGGVTSVTEPSPTPPAEPVSGQLWYDTDSGKIYVYLTDSWVDTSPTLAPSSLVTGIYTVTLDSEGNLILPDGGDILDGDGNSVLGGGANAAAQQNTINYLLTNAAIQSGNINALRANINAANTAIITANVGMKSYVDNLSTNWVANAAIQEVNINTIFSNLSAQASNAAAQQTTINYLLSNSASQDTQLIALRANINSANAAIITANVAMKSYVDSVTSSFDGSWVDNAATQAENINIIFGNIAVLKSNAISQQNTINYLLSNSAAQDSQLSALIANVNAANAAIITANVGMKSYVDDAVLQGTANAATQEARIDDIYANLAVRVGNSTAQQNTINYLLLNAAIQSANIISLYSNASAQEIEIGALRANINAANSIINTKTVYSNSNVAAYLLQYPQGSSTYNNANVASYLLANPPSGTYNDANVAAYIVANPPSGTYSNSNVAAYLIENPEQGLYGNSNVAAYLTANPEQGLYGNSNVAAYLTAHPEQGLYSNSNVAAYLTTYTGSVSKLSTTDTTNSISTSTGSLVTAGGLGVAQDVHIGGTVNITNDTPSTSYDNGALVINGGLGVNGNINLSGNINILEGNINIVEFTGATGNFYGDPVTGFGAMYAGKSGFTALPYTVAQISTNSNSYSQVNIENINSGKLASADYIGTGDIGDDSNWFFDIGIAGSGYDPELAAENNAPGTSVGPLDAYYYVQGNTSVPETGGNLTIGTSQDSKVVKFIAGGVNAENVVLTLSQNNITAAQDIIAPNVYADGLFYNNSTNIVDSINTEWQSNAATQADNISALQANIDAANSVISSKTSYSNVDVASYLVVNPQAGTYSNSNVASYLVSNPQAGTYSNSNVASYLTGTVNVGNLITTSGVFWSNGVAYSSGSGSSYSNADVASYLPTYTGNIATGNVNFTTANFNSKVLLPGGAYINTPSSSTGTILLQPNTAASSFPGVQIGGTGLIKGPGGGSAMALSNTDVTFPIPIKAPAYAASSTTTGGLQSAGGIGVVGSAYIGGNVVVTGNIIVNGNSAVSTPNRPAFRVYGTLSTDIIANTTVTATQGATVDYNQGNNYVNSTGIFTAPLAGLYQAFATLRVGNNNGMNQASIQKNSSQSGGNVIAFWETDTNTGTAMHFSMTGIAKLAAGDTLRLQVLSGNVRLDTNDSWGVSFIG